MFTVEHGTRPGSARKPGRVDTIVIVTRPRGAIGRHRKRKARVVPGHSSLENEAVTSAVSVFAGPTSHEGMMFPRRARGRTHVAIGTSDEINEVRARGSVHCQK